MSERRNKTENKKLWFTHKPTVRKYLIMIGDTLKNSTPILAYRFNRRGYCTY
jgi:hypothetical protein